MLEISIRVLAFLATLGSGLMAGLFFAFSVSVMGALARAPAAEGAAAMKSINVVILNPLFGVAFFGTALVSLLLIMIVLIRWGAPGSLYLVAGALLYLLGIIVVTMIFNVPLNNALAAARPDTPEGAAVWARYLAEWVPWNHVRTVAGLAALACFALGLRELEA